MLKLLERSYPTNRHGDQKTRPFLDKGGALLPFQAIGENEQGGDLNVVKIFLLLDGL